MKTDNDLAWLGAVRDTVKSYRQMIDATIVQLTDDELFLRPAPGINSVAVILRHLGGNLRSRWTDFLTTDGEKPDRDRDREFLDWEGDRNSLMQYFYSGWKALEEALESIDDQNIGAVIKIRGEPHTIPQAVTRSVTHFSYHVGQITMIARMVHHGDWRWLTIAPGSSAEHNHKTWGTKESRSVGSAKNEQDSGK